MPPDSPPIESQLSEAAVRDQMRATADVEKFQRLGFLLNLAHGDSVTEAITREGRSPATGYRWKKQWKAGGLEAMLPDTSGGRPPKLDEDDWERLRSHVHAIQPCSTQQICQLLQAEFNVTYNYAYLERILPEHGFSYTMPVLEVARHEGTLDAVEWDDKQHPNTTERNAFDMRSRPQVGKWTVSARSDSH